MTAPHQRAGGLDANARGIMVLVVAVLIGLLLLWNTDDSDGGTDVASGGDTTTTVDTSDLGSDDPDQTTTPEEAGGETTTTEAATEGRAPGEVKVVVLNNGGPAGSAALGTAIFEDAGYVMGEPANGTPPELEAAAAVYFAEGYETEAAAAASLMGQPADIVAPMPDPLPGPGADTANLVVVIGTEAPPIGAPAETTTTEAGT